MQLDLLYKKPKLSKRKRLGIILLCLCVLFAGFNYYFTKYVNPIIISYSEAKIRNLTVKAVNSAIGNVVPTSYIYDSLVTINKTSENKISSITTNPIQMNQLANDLAKNTQKELETLAGTGIYIPVGTFTGMPIFTGRGPTVNIRVLPVGSVVCEFTSSFQTAGINQTLHQIKLVVTSLVSLILPITRSQTFKNSAEVLLCESIIVGEVPEIYMTGEAQGSIDLSP